MLHLALKFGHDRLPSTVLKTEPSGATPLALAASSGHLACVTYLHSVGSPVCCASGSTEGLTAVHAAAEGGHCDVLQYLTGLAAADPSALDCNGNTPLHRACQGGHLGAVTFLTGLDCVDVNACNKQGSKAVMMASSVGHLAVMHALVQAGAHAATAADSAGVTTLMKAASAGHTEVSATLLAASMHSSVSAPFVAKLAPQIVQYLLCEEGADVSTTSDSGTTALLCAAHAGHAAVVRACLRAGASPWQVCFMFATPQTRPKRQNELSQADNTGRTPLVAACHGGHLQVASPLSRCMSAFLAFGALSCTQLSRLCAYWMQTEQTLDQW